MWLTHQQMHNVFQSTIFCLLIFFPKCKGWHCNKVTMPNRNYCFQAESVWLSVLVPYSWSISQSCAIGGTVGHVFDLADSTRTGQSERHTRSRWSSGLRRPAALTTEAVLSSETWYVSQHQRGVTNQKTAVDISAALPTSHSASVSFGLPYLA
jgi:hypothetical protein